MCKKEAIFNETSLISISSTCSLISVLNCICTYNLVFNKSLKNQYGVVVKSPAKSIKDKGYWNMRTKKNAKETCQLRIDERNKWCALVSIEITWINRTIMYEETGASSPVPRKGEQRRDIYTWEYLFGKSSSSSAISDCRVQLHHHRK